MKEYKLTYKQLQRRRFDHVSRPGDCTAFGAFKFCPEELKEICENSKECEQQGNIGSKAYLGEGMSNEDYGNFVYRMTKEYRFKYEDDFYDFYRVMVLIASILRLFIKEKKKSKPRNIRFFKED